MGQMLHTTSVHCITSAHTLLPFTVMLQNIDKHCISHFAHTLYVCFLAALEQRGPVAIALDDCDASTFTLHHISTLMFCALSFPSQLWNNVGLLQLLWMTVTPQMYTLHHILTHSIILHTFLHIALEQRGPVAIALDDCDAQWPVDAHLASVVVER